MDNQLTIKNQAELDKRMQKTWMLHGECYQFTGYTVIGEQLLVSTDRKILMYPAADVGAFLKALFPVETAVQAVQTNIVPAVALHQNHLATMRDMMMEQFLHIAQNPTEVNLLRAKSMASVAGSYMKLVKTELSIHKALKLE